MTHPLPHSVPRNPSLGWLPYVITFLGIILSISVWFSLVYETPVSKVLSSFHNARHWVALILGIFLSILFGLAIRLTQLSALRKQSFDVLNEHFRQEIAERIHAEETKQKLEKELLQGQKLQAIGTLAGGIAHDFNNILYAIVGYVEMAREDVDKESLIYKNLGKVLEATHRGHDLISRILAFSRHQHHELSAIPLKETVEGALSLLRPTIPASVSILFHATPESDCLIMGNQTQIHQILVNLINNAVDAMDSEGIVRIELSVIPSTDEILKQFSNSLPTSYCKIDISDTGHGMDKTTMERIFEPFYTTKEVGRGTGLGLSTVHSIMQEHEGEIVVKSQLGKGTTFTLLLPIHNETE